MNTIVPSILVPRVNTSAAALSVFAEPEELAYPIQESRLRLLL